MAQWDLSQLFADVASHNRNHIRNHAWIDSRIQAELIDEHPHLYLQMVFQYFRMDFTSCGIGGGSGTGDGSFIPIILSAFGWFPTRYACDGNVYEFVERPDELRRLWDTFRGNSFYDRHGWPFEDVLDAVLPETPPPEYSKYLGPNFPVTFSQIVQTLLNCFIKASLAVKQLRLRSKFPRIPFTTLSIVLPPELVFQIRVSFGLTLFSHFRSMVHAHARQYNELFGPMAKAKADFMAYLQGDANARAIYSVELFRFLCSNEKFVNRNGTERLSGPLMDFLVNRLDVFRVDCPVPEGKGQVDKNIKMTQLVTLSEETYRYLSWNCILPHSSKLTHSVLIDILLDSMFEHEDHCLASHSDHTRPQQKNSHFEVLRNQLIWYFIVWEHVTQVIKNNRIVKIKTSPLSNDTSNSNSNSETKQPSPSPPVTGQYLWDATRDEWYPANGFSNAAQVNFAEDCIDSD